MKLSVVVRSKDEAPRLRLTLASLSRQTHRPEIVVVNDGSSDETADVIDAAARGMPIVAVHNTQAQGRSAAANAGARAASGDVLLFLDGDTLAHPQMAARHLAAHAAGPVVARGETFHLRGTRQLKDPETGEAWPDAAARVVRLPAAELERMRVTEDQVLGDFAAIEARAEAGIYPGAGPRRLYELEMDALVQHPECEVLWAAASGSNQSVRRDAFLAVGGFDPAIDINEHRELALKLLEKGARMVPVPGARSYHLTHRTAWRDPLNDLAWEARFYGKHPIPAVKLLAVFWGSLSFGARVPAEAQIHSLPELAEAARRGDQGRYEVARELIFALAVARPTQNMAAAS